MTKSTVIIRKSAAFGAWVLILSAITGLTFHSANAFENGKISAEEYDYPISEPIRATLVGTPSAFKAKRISDAPLEPGVAVIYPNRKVPEIFLVFGRSTLWRCRSEITLTTHVCYWRNRRRSPNF